MKIKIREKTDITILDLEGNIDINASDFVEVVGWVLNNKSKNIICNFESVNLVDYVGISLIAVIYKNVLNHQGRIKFYAIPSHVRKLFSIVGLDRVFEYHLGEEDTLEQMRREIDTSHSQEEHLRRRFKRIPFKANIEYRPKLGRRNDFYTGKIVNLSAEGIFLVSQQIYSVGEVLLTRMDLMPQPGVLEVDTKVVWVADEEIQPHEFPGMGLEFYNLDAGVQEKIVQFVEKHLARSM